MEEKSGGAWLVMKRSDTVFNGGKLAGSAVEQVIAATVGQPAPSLFQIPSGYTGVVLRKRWPDGHWSWIGHVFTASGQEKFSIRCMSRLTVSDGPCVGRT